MGRIVEEQSPNSIKKEPDRIVKERVISAGTELPLYRNNLFVVFCAIFLAAFILFLIG